MSDQMELLDHALFSQGCVGKQAAFHQSQSESRWCIAGNQSGKTTCGAREASYHATGLHPYRHVSEPSIGWVITLDRTFANDVLLPVVLHFLPSQLVKKVTRGDAIRIDLQNGSQIVFKTYGQGWDKFQGAKIHWAWFDEECPEAVYDETMVRLMAYKGSHWVTMTPLQGKTWIYKRIFSKRHEFSKADLEIFKWRTTDNTTLDARRVEKTFGRMDPKIRNARMDGDFVSLEGLIWPQFDERVHLVDEFKLEPHWPIVVGMDYGYRHPFSAVFVAVDETGRRIVWKTYSQPERLMMQHARAILRIFLEHAPHAVDQQAAERVLRAIEERKVPNERPFIRAQFRLDSSAQQCKRELLPYGIGASNAERDVDARLQIVGSALTATIEGRPGLVLMRGRNGALVDEMRGYSWKKKKIGDDSVGKDQPQDFDDDACDALGYALTHAADKAQVLAVKPPEMSPEWLRQLRGNVQKVSQRMGNERIPPEIIHARMMRLGRAW